MYNRKNQTYMKHFILSLAAVTMMSITTMAQETESNQNSKPKFDKTEMIQKRTEMIAKKYDLSDAQQKQLLALNTKYADKLGRPMMGKRPGRPEMNGRGMRPDSMQQKRPEMTEEQNTEMKAKREEMKATMDAYNKELQSIMTPEQFQKYQEDSKNHMKRGEGEHRPSMQNDDNK